MKDHSCLCLLILFAFQNAFIGKAKVKSYLVCGYFEVTVCNACQWNCLAQANNSCFIVFLGAGGA